MRIQKSEFFKVAWIINCVLVLSDAIVSHKPTEKSQKFFGNEYTFLCDNNHIRHHHKKPHFKECSSTNSSIFVTKNQTIITAQTGSTAILPCILMGFVNGVVSWKRLENYTLLTVGSARYTASNRYVPEQVKTQNTQHWRLLIKYVQHSDAGMYECQISTYPPAHIHMRLKIIDAYAIINGSPELHIKNGSEMHLICKFMQSTEEPSFVFWYHEDVMISFDQYRGINTGKNKTGSTLSISSINHSHSGNYSCVPSNTRPASILVHILDVSNFAEGRREPAMSLVTVCTNVTCVASGKESSVRLLLQAYAPVSLISEDAARRLGIDVPTVKSLRLRSTMGFDFAATQETFRLILQVGEERRVAHAHVVERGFDFPADDVPGADVDEFLSEHPQLSHLTLAHTGKGHPIDLFLSGSFFWDCMAPKDGRIKLQPVKNGWRLQLTRFGWLLQGPSKTSDTTIMCSYWYPDSYVSL